MSVSGANIIQHKAQVIIEHRHQINEGAAWTIVSTDKTEYQFFEAMGPVETSISPCPVVSSPEVNGHCENARVELIGSNFKPNLTVWFGATAAETIFRSEESISCRILRFEQVQDEFFTNKTSGDVEVAVSLYTEDGIVYPTKFKFTYNSLENR